MAISKELLDILACPKCKGEICLTETGDGMICETCRLLYEIRTISPSCSSKRQNRSPDRRLYPIHEVRQSQS